MVSYKDDVGHLNIDHQYKHCDNLGGWAANMSTKYKNWKAGNVTVSSEMEAQFDELKALGFNFDVASCYETTRTWDDHFEKLVEYKDRNGNARVPLKWKADLRLGKWVQLQRKAKRTKKLSHEHREYYYLCIAVWKLLFSIEYSYSLIVLCFTSSYFALQLKSWKILDSSGRYQRKGRSSN